MTQGKNDIVYFEYCGNCAKNNNTHNNKIYYLVHVSGYSSIVARSITAPGRSDFPVSFLRAVGKNKSVAEAASKVFLCFMETAGGIVHNYQHFCQHSVPRHLLQGRELGANNSLFNELVPSVGVLRFDSCAPAYQRKNIHAGKDLSLLRK